MARQLTARYRRHGAPFIVLTVELNGASPTQVRDALNRQRLKGTAMWERTTRDFIARYHEYVTVDKAYYNRDTGYVQEFGTGEVVR